MRMRRHHQQDEDTGIDLTPMRDVVVIMPPLSVTLDELDELCRAAESGIDDAT